MNSASKIIGISLLWAIFIAIVIVSLVNDTAQLWTNGTIIIGWFLFVSNYTYHKSDRIYMLVQLIMFQIKNPNCIWNFRILLNNSNGNFSFEHFTQWLYEKYDINSIKVKALSRTRHDYKVGTLRFELSLNEQNNQLIMDFQDIEVGYRRTKSIMEGDLTQIIEKLKILYKPDKEQYGVKIIFKELNPYFGMYLKKLNVYDVDAFKVSFHLQEDRVKVNKNSIEINSNSFDSLKTNAKSYLTLSPSR